MFACWSPDFSFLILTALWIFLPISYLLLNGCSNSHSPTSYKEVPYSPLQSDASQQPGVSKLSFNDMLVLTWRTQEQFIPLFVGIFCKTLLIGGVVTTIAFSNIPITPRNQYLLYTLASGIGDLLSRPYLVYLSLCAIGDKFVVKKTWVPALLTVFITIFMVCDSWFRLIPEFSFALVLVVFNTFLQGIVYVNSFLNAGEGLSVEEKRFCRALMASAIWLPNVVGGLIGLDTEIQLRQHCLLFHTEVVCYTRSHTVWNPNVSCVI